MNEEEQRSKDENPLEKHVESRPPSGKEMMMWDSMLSHREGICSCGKFHSNSGGAAEICEVREGCQKVHVVGRSASSIATSFGAANSDRQVHRSRSQFLTAPRARPCSEIRFWKQMIRHVKSIKDRTRGTQRPRLRGTSI